MSVRDRQDDILDDGALAGDLADLASRTASILDVRILFTPTLPLLRLSGELDLESVHLLADAVDCIATTSSRAGMVVLDLSGVTFCDVAGLRAIETCSATLATLGMELVLHNPSPQVARLIAMAAVRRRRG